MSDKAREFREKKYPFHVAKTSDDGVKFVSVSLCDELMQAYADQEVKGIRKELSNECKKVSKLNQHYSQDFRAGYESAVTDLVIIIKNA